MGIGALARPYARARASHMHPRLQAVAQQPLKTPWFDLDWSVTSVSILRRLCAYTCMYTPDLDPRNLPFPTALFLTRARARANARRLELCFVASTDIARGSPCARF
eukprot:4868149-Pleurochrysis_carterae.AAC.1